MVKSEHLKKVELIKEINQLKIKVQNYEKEKSTHIYNKHGEFHKDFTVLQDMDIKFSQDRRTEKSKLQQQLMAINNKVSRFHRELENVKPTPEFVEKLKVIMEDVEEKVTSFKDQQRQLYEEIMKEERITSQEILAIEKKIEMWAQQGAAAAAGVSTTKQKTSFVSGNTDVTKDLPPEVAAFERFVEQSGGVRAGWDEYDHSAFLRYRVKHKGKPTFIRELIPALPTRTEHEIIDHERWYQQYIDLNEDKKEAIQKWKEKKEVEKQTVLAHAEGDEEDEEEQRKQREEKYKEVVGQEKYERKIMLNRWKVERELEKAEEEERRLRDQLEKAKKRDLTKLRQEEQRLKVYEYKMQKEEERQIRENEQLIKERLEAEMKRENAGHNIVKFQSRDIQSVQKKLQKEKLKEEEEREKELRLRRLKSRVEVHVDRDPSRLLQPTQGWRERQKDPSSSGGQILHMPHRAVPTWRQGP